MKKGKKLIALVLMVALFVPTNVFGLSDSEQEETKILKDYIKTNLVVTENENEYEFVPRNSGIYEISLEGDTEIVELYVYDEDGNQVLDYSDSKDDLDYYTTSTILNQGETYTVEINKNSAEVATLSIYIKAKVLVVGTISDG